MCWSTGTECVRVMLDYGLRTLVPLPTRTRCETELVSRWVWWTSCDVPLFSNQPVTKHTRVDERAKNELTGQPWFNQRQHAHASGHTGPGRAVAMSIRDNNQQLNMRVLTRSGARRCGIQTSPEYTGPCQCARKVISELGLSDLEHGNETAVQTDSV